MTWTTYGFIAVWITVRYTSIDMCNWWIPIKNGGLTNPGEGVNNHKMTNPIIHDANIVGIESRNYGIQATYCILTWTNLLGGWLHWPTLWKMMEFVKWGYYSQYTVWKNKTCSKPPNQYQKDAVRKMIYIYGGGKFHIYVRSPNLGVHPT
jgi:hypothetical protein